MERWLGSVIRGAAKAHDLQKAGYGITGVCNDSVAIIEHALFGQATAYPLLMRDEVVLAELGQARQAGGALDAAYAALATSIAAVPSDTEPQPSAAQRALASLPWQPGQEPFASTVEARRILTGSLGK